MIHLNVFLLLTFEMTLLYKGKKQAILLRLTPKERKKKQTRVSQALGQDQSNVCIVAIEKEEAQDGHNKYLNR